MLPDDEFHHWDNLLRCFYRMPVDFRSENGMSTVLDDILGLTERAEYCCSMRSASVAIDSQIVRLGQSLWQSVARNPTAWAKLALRIRCEMVFREAIVHLVGMWPCHLITGTQEVIERAVNKADDPKKPVEEGNNDTQAAAAPTEPDTSEQLARIKDLPLEIRQLCDKKNRVLASAKLDIEKHIACHYPSHLHRNGFGGRSDDPERDDSIRPNVTTGSRTTREFGHSVKSQSYAHDIISWMALNHYRHFFAQMTITDAGAHALDGGAKFYRALYAAGDAYLDRRSTESFCTRFPLSSKSRDLFEQQLAMLKEAVRGYVADIVKCQLVMNLEQAKQAGITMEYLTSAVIKTSDLPWIKKRARGGGYETLPWPGDIAEEPKVPDAVVPSMIVGQPSPVIEPADAPAPAPSKPNAATSGPSSTHHGSSSQSKPNHGSTSTPTHRPSKAAPAFRMTAPVDPERESHATPWGIFPNPNASAQKKRKKAPSVTASPAGPPASSTAATQLAAHDAAATATAKTARDKGATGQESASRKTSSGQPPSKKVSTGEGPSASRSTAVKGAVPSETVGKKNSSGDLAARKTSGGESAVQKTPTKDPRSKPPSSNASNETPKKQTKSASAQSPQSGKTSKILGKSILSPPEPQTVRPAPVAQMGNEHSVGSSKGREMTKSSGVPSPSQAKASSSKGVPAEGKKKKGNEPISSMFVEDSSEEDVDMEDA